METTKTITGEHLSDAIDKVVTLKKQKPSATYTLTQFTAMIDKLLELDLITKVEAADLRRIRGSAKAKYIEKL